jgi:hypothetical protein
VGCPVVCSVVGVPSSSFCYVNLCSSLNPSSFLWCNSSSVVKNYIYSKKVSLSSFDDDSRN